MGNILYFKLKAPSSSDSVKAKIVKIDAIIDALLITAMTSVTNGHIVEYEMDNGQTRTNVTYSKTSEITNAIQTYENLRVYYDNKLKNRNVRLVDQSNFRRRR